MEAPKSVGKLSPDSGNGKSRARTISRHCVDPTSKFSYSWCVPDVSTLGAPTPDVPTLPLPCLHGLFLDYSFCLIEESDFDEDFHCTVKHSNLQLIESLSTCFLVQDPNRISTSLLSNRESRCCMKPVPFFQSIQDGVNSLFVRSSKLVLIQHTV